MEAVMTYGVPGPKGDTGATGSRGPQGIQGPQGPAGTNGVKTMKEIHYLGTTHGVYAVIAIYNAPSYGLQSARGIGRGESMSLTHNGTTFINFTLSSSGVFTYESSAYSTTIDLWGTYLVFAFM